MPLMERVVTLLRANLGDLIERAEDPEKLLRQFLLDMENQLLQVKTQVAVALADQHLLEERAQAQKQAIAEWHRKAALAVSKGDDVSARTALVRALQQEASLEALQIQLQTQAHETQAVHATYTRLQAKLAETRERCDAVLAEHRRAQFLRLAAAKTSADFQRSATDGEDAGLDKPESGEQVETLLAELKSRRGVLRTG